MARDGEIRFGRYSLHPVQGLTCGAREVRVTPKSLALLRSLAERAGQVVTKDELFRFVWPNTVVSDAALASCIRELRRALEDDARRPRYIETLHRRGYRFLAHDAARTIDGRGPAAASPGGRAASIVGRDDTLERLAAALARAAGGRRQVVLVTGEPGIGKTALAEAFLADISNRADVRIARADCVERYGAGEAYQPLLEALTRLSRQPGDDRLVAALRRLAPTWLAQLPALQTAEEHNDLQRQTIGATPSRMLRELNDALESLASTATVVLLLEDLHWCDFSTLDWIASFARRPERACLLLIATVRPDEPTPAGEALRHLGADLRAKNLCEEASLAGLDETSVHEYVTGRFPAADGATAAIERLARLVYRQTEGNPLFVVNVLGDLDARGLLTERDGVWTPRADISAASLRIPDDVRRLIEQRIEMLEDGEQRVLEIASVTGGAFSAAAIAAAAELDIGAVEATLRGLARRRSFVRESAEIEWPDGTLAGGFEFLHALYREVLGQRLSPTRRANLHRRIGMRLESAYGSRALEIAAALAVHFDEARDTRRAIEYLTHAAETDRKRAANRAAEAHYRRALALLERLPVSPDRERLELTLRMGLGGALMATHGFGAAEVEECYARARELCGRLGSTQQLFPVLWGLWLFYLGHGSLAMTREVADTLLGLTSEADDSSIRLQAHHVQWATALSEGDIRAVEEHAERGIALYDVERHSDLTSAYGDHDPGVCALIFAARAAALSGRTETAAERSARAIALARSLGHPFSLALALVFAAFTHQTCRDAAATREHAMAAVELAREHGFALMLGWATALEGWSLAADGEHARGLRLLREGVAAAQATKSSLFVPHLLSVVAETELECDLAGDARATLDVAWALAERNGDRLASAELHRLKGELELAAAPADTAHRHRAAQALRSAIAVAEAQGAKLLALRAATRLSRLPLDDGEAAAARRLVAGLRGAVSEGASLPDLVAADALLSAASVASD